jgi:hypothetical protein
LLCVADGMVRVSIAMGKAALENPHMVGEHHIYVNECWKVKMVKFDIQFHKKIDTEIVILILVESCNQLRLLELCYWYSWPQQVSWTCNGQCNGLQS